MLKFKQYKLFIFTITILAFEVFGISCQTIRKEEVLQIKIPKCNNDADCNENSSCYDGYCNIRYMCHDDDCIPMKKDWFFDDMIDKNNYKESNTTNLILKACPLELRNTEECFTSYCTQDSNCYSNKCFNNTCIINESFTTNICYGRYATNKMACLKTDYEKCNSKDECYAGTICEDNICKPGPDKHMYDGIKKPLFIIGFIIILIIIAMVGCCIYICKKRNT